MGQGWDSLCIAPRLLLHLLTQPQLPSHTAPAKACEFLAVPGCKPGQRAAIQPKDSRSGGKHSRAMPAVKLSAGQELASRKRDGAMRNAELAADLRASHQTRQIYSPREGKAGPGQWRGLAQAPGEKTSREAAITPATALARCRHGYQLAQLRQLSPGFGPAVPVMPKAGEDTGHQSPVLAASLCHHALPCSAAQQDLLSPGTPPSPATAFLV